MAQEKSPSLFISGSSIPYEIALSIFKHLNHADLASSSLVSNDWNFAACSPILWQAFNLRKIFPSSIYLNEDWKSDFNFDVEIKPLNKRYIISLLKARCPFLKNQKVFQTHTFLEVPKGITLEDFTNPEFFISLLHSDIFKKYGKIPITHTHCLLITNKIIPASLSKKFYEQKQIISNYPLYKIPSFITAVALNMARLMNTKHYYAFAMLHQAPSFAVFMEHARWCQIEVNIGRIAPPIELGLNATDKGRGIIAAREFH